MKINEKEFLILRYLGWHRTLLEHPDYMKQIQGRSGSRTVQKKGTPIIKNYIEDDNRPELTHVYMALNSNWPQWSHSFGWRVELLSAAFCSAVEEAKDAFGRNEELCCSYLAGKEFKGTLLIPHLDSSLSYDLKFNDSGTGFDRHIYLQMGNSDCVVLFFDGRLAFVTNTMHLADIKTGELAPVEERNRMTRTLDFIDNLDSFVVSYLCFLKFANVQEKFVAGSGSRQARNIDAEKDYVNETPVSIRQMTASYYTTTVRTEGFPRKGFFRMQPHKVNGEWTHYLKWIDATYVSGYTRKAKILTNNF